MAHKATSVDANPDIVAQIKSQLLVMPELGDDSVSFGGTLSLTSRKLSGLRKKVTETYVRITV